MTPAQITLWLALIGPPPDAYFVPGCAFSYAATLDYYADAAMVPRSLARAVVQAESEYWPKAQSRRGGKVIARELLQISVEHQAEHVWRAGMRMPKSEADLSDRDVFVWHSPAKSARVGLSYLGRLLARYGDRRLAVAAYNCGPARLESGRALPAETIGYLTRIFGGQL